MPCKRCCARAGVEDYLRTDAVLSLYVSNHHWPGWVAGLLNDPAVTKILKVLQDAGEPVLLAKLPELVPDIAPETIRAALNGLISYLAVFEDLHPQTKDIMVGLLPAVRKSLAALLVPRHRPPLVECVNPGELGPEESLIVEDLRGSLLEIASEPPRLRRDKAPVPEGSGSVRRVAAHDTRLDGSGTRVAGGRASGQGS